MTPEDQQELIRALAVFVKERVEQACAPLRERIIELEKRGLSYCGVYQRAAVYRRGDVCTHDGSMFVAVADVAPNQVPGQGGVWVLSVKGTAQPRQPTAPRTQQR